jgi:tetratricopeptide (TPR) repeat protein
MNVLTPFLFIAMATSPSPAPEPVATPDAAASAAASQAAAEFAKIYENAPAVAKRAARARAQAIAEAKREIAAASAGRAVSTVRLAAAWRGLGYADERSLQWRPAYSAYGVARTTDRRANRAPAHAVDSDFLARVAYELRDYDSARTLFENCLVDLQHPGDRESPLANECRLGLGRSYALEGRWRAAETVTAKALSVDETFRPWDDASRGADLIAMGDVLLAEERDAEALADFERGEKYVRGSAIRTQALTDAGAPGLTHAMLGLGADPSSLELVSQADFFLESTDRIDDLKSGDLRSPDATAAVVLARIEADEAAGGARAASADTRSELTATLDALLKLDGEAGRPGIGTADVYRVLGDTSSTLHDQAAAREWYLLSRETYRRALGSHAPQIGALDGRLATTALEAHRYAEAIRLFKLALSERDAAGLGNAPLAQALTVALGQAYDHDGRVGAADAAYARSLAMMRSILHAAGPLVTERQRVELLAAARNTCDRYAAFLMSRRPEGYAGTLFDVALLGKEIVAGSRSSVDAISPSDAALAPLVARLATERRRVADADSGGVPNAIEHFEADLAEADLVAAATAAQPRTRPEIAWQDVRGALRPHETAVEYLHVGERYIALVLPSDANEPAVLPIASDAQLERAMDPASTRALYDLVWLPVTPWLHGTTRVYFAADGQLDRVAFATLERSDGRDLSGIVDLRQMTSTKELLVPAQSSASKSAAIRD